MPLQPDVYMPEVRRRVQALFESEPLKHLAPKVTEWKYATTSDFLALQRFSRAITDEVQKDTSSREAEIGDFSPVTSSLETHLALMRNAFRVLGTFPLFRENFRELSPDFIDSAVESHDLGRRAINGPLPLTMGDGISEALLRRLLTRFPTGYLHSIRWITGEKIPPSQESPVGKFALMLKTIDTFGKPGVNPEVFFEPGGQYDQWVRTQVKLGRLPLTSVVLSRTNNDRTRRPTVTTEQYAKRDKALTLAGKDLIEQMTGIPFPAFWNQVLAMQPLQ